MLKLNPTPILLFLLITIASLISTEAYAINAKRIWTKKCSTCHTIGGGKKVGPDLKGVTERRKVNWLIKFIKNPMGLIKSGDKTAVSIYNQFDKVEFLLL